MTQTFSKFIGGLLLAGAMLWAGSGVAEAAGKPLDLSTSPLPINLVTPPGGTVSADIRVKQNTGETTRLKVQLLKFTAFGEEGKPRIVDRQPGDDYFDWVSFNKTEFTAPDNEWQTIKMTIKVPKQGAAFGYYYAVVFTRVGDDARPEESAAAFVGGSATMVLLDVRVPGAQRKVELESFSTRHRIVEFLPAKFDVKFKNIGNIHLVPSGNIFITQGSKQVGALPINDQLGNILPDTKRIYPVDWLDGYPVFEPSRDKDGAIKTDKKNNVVYTLNWDFKNKNPLERLRVGKYSAHLFAVYDDGTRDIPVESTISFWVIPWRIILGLLVVSLLVGFGIWSITRGALKGADRLRRGRGRRR